MKKILMLFFFGLNIIQCSKSSRILAAIVTPSYSHQVFYQMLWRELAIRGHDVVVLTTDPTHEKIPNFSEIDMSSAYTVMRKSIADVIHLNDNKLAAFMRFASVFYEVADFELALPEIQALIHDPNEHFDLLIAEYLYPAFYPMKHRFNCSFIGVTSMDGMNFAHEIMGNPTHAVLYPFNMFASSAGMSLTERVFSVFFNIIVHMARPKIENEANYLVSKHYGDDYPGITEIAESVDMFFVNGNPMFSDIRPFTPSTISLAGGMHMKPIKQLPKDLKQFMDKSTQGVIYFSMGSNVQSKNLSNATLKIIKETFSQLPYNVLWKFEAANLPGKPKNVKIIKWAPQQDVLRHKNVKLFITQAGMQSLEEALFSHVPLITIPFFADQDSNAGRVAHKELGLMMNYKTLTVDEFKAGIVEVITNPKYKANIKKLALQIQDQPMTPLQKAVWWTEYILRHKTGQHLKGPQIPFYQYYFLDVWFFLITLTLFIYFLAKVVCKLISHFAKNSRIKVKKA